MHKFFTPSSLLTGDFAFIEGEDVKHIYKVLRLDKGTEILINNLQGEEFKGIIEEITKERVTVRLIEKSNTNNESPINIYLYQGIPKAGKMDIIVQKNTELGVRAIIPVVTTRTDVVVKGEFKKLDRLQRIALESCKQCKRTIIPRIMEPVSFKTMVEELKEKDLVLVPYENEDDFGMKGLMAEVADKKIESVAMVVGPEGGFEPSEIEELKAIGAYILTLGPRILRTETAGFTLAALLQYEFGDLGGMI